MKICKATQFKAAHKIAKETVAKVGDYMIAFKLALKSIWAKLKTPKAKRMVTIQNNGIVRETEKAVLVACKCEGHVRDFVKNIWFPKSRIEIDGETVKAESWLHQAKSEELNGAWLA